MNSHKALDAKRVKKSAEEALGNAVKKKGRCRGGGKRGGSQTLVSYIRGVKE